MARGHAVGLLVGLLVASACGEPEQAPTGPGDASAADAPDGTDSGVGDSATRDVADAGDPACGARVANYTYVRPFGASAPWNVPVCGLPKWAASDVYRERFWRYGYPGADPKDPDANRGKLIVDFGLGSDPSTDYAPPVYDAAQATTKKRVRLRNAAPYTNLAATDTVPWNPAWRAMGGGDAVAIILDKATGREWDFFGIVQSVGGVFNDSQCWLTPDYDAQTDLCVSSAYLVRRPDTNAVADFRTYTGNFPSRGVQIQFYAMVVTPEEVAAGEIRHALMMGVANTMFGPACTASELATAAAGTTCGYALAPAGGLEWNSRCSSCPPSPLSDLELRSRSVPEGMRLAIDVTDADIDAWLATRGYAGPKRATARAFAVALRDYGWFITDTAGMAAFAVSGSSNEGTAKAWRNLGIDGDGTDLLAGLFTKERLYVVAPATNDCSSGPSHVACPAANTHY